MKYINAFEMMNLKKLVPPIYFDPNRDITPLRFVFVHKDAKKIIAAMEKYIETDYIWFRSPIVCCNISLEKLGYVQGCCEKSEKLSEQIVNWPCVTPEFMEDKLIQLFFKIMKTVDIST
jgi:hypothetical protein